MILITGASGFLGRTFLECLPDGVEVETIGRTDIAGVSRHYQCDLGDVVPKLLGRKYKKVVHFAGKAHMVPKTQAETDAFYKTNLQGTINLLQALEKSGQIPETFVTSSTIAVYGLEKGSNISEATTPNPQTPYGESKLQAEKVIQEWCDKHRVQYLILRLPLIAGKNPPGNLGMMKTAIQKGRYPRIGKNQAAKSMVLAEDIAELIINHKSGSGIYNLTDGIHPSFYQIEKAVEKRVGKNIKINIPLFALQPFAVVGDLIEKITKKPFPISSGRLKKLTDTLTFDDSKARKEIGWNPKPVLPFIEKYL